METLFNALTPFYPSQSTQKISNQSITRNPPFTNVDLTESILGVIKEVEQVLVKIHGDVERMIDDQNEEGITRDELDIKTRDMEEVLLEHIDELLKETTPLHSWALLLRGMKVQYSHTTWDYTNEYRNFIHAFEPVFANLKKNVSSNFPNGSKQYAKAFTNGVKGAWEARANARRHDIDTRALPDLKAIVELVAERTEDREGLRDRVRQQADEKKREKNRKRNIGRKKAKAKAKAMEVGRENAEEEFEVEEEEAL